ncbi:MAG: phosphoribosyl-AMP cyclohydrolase [Clostridiales bacterium]|nr:phosphoribosyl-AMP cyclohydrolase [Clostridiales bacterium]
MKLNQSEGHELDDFFQKSELIPAIAQDIDSGQVLMLAYMNRQSLDLTIQTGTAWYYSRSREELWNKGATSGNFQHICEIRYDCDKDTLLLLVRQRGAACHTGAFSCFYRTLALEDDK